MQKSGAVSQRHRRKIGKDDKDNDKGSKSRSQSMKEKSVINELTSGEIVSLNFIESIKEARSCVQDLTSWEIVSLNLLRFYKEVGHSKMADFGFFQIPIALEDQEKTTFTCPYRTFAYRRMPFGLCNAPATFQRCMMAIFHDMVEDFMEVFMDDFSVFDKKGAENLAADHLSRLEKPDLGTFTEEEITDEFPDKHLMILKAELNNDEPWYADYDEPYAFKLCSDNVMRRCVAGNEILEILGHCHFGPTGGHHSASITERKVYESGFNWPSIFKDAKDYVMRCDACQRSGNISSRKDFVKEISTNIGGEFSNLEDLEVLES
ncbi:reverse transcriptase domain-containing protein [Tanacetum coccineum]|uniref:Reverse transcriptase domain-containing protein n=1 Tax=Tanacetum coccineum TaxID=301880 RepID=A0ABQ4ZAH5_9ASTR